MTVANFIYDDPPRCAPHFTGKERDPAGGPLKLLLLEWGS